MTRKLRRLFRRLVSAGALSTCAVATLGGCGSVSSGDPDVDAMAFALCAEHGAVCVPYSVKTAIPFVPDPDINWGFFSSHKIDTPVGDARIGYVCFDDEKCAEDIDLCGAVILHEIGHMVRGANEVSADCWAATHATPEQYQALEDYRCRRSASRCRALKECAQ